ncbi:MAG: heavy-metal-associated domain-containing protein [Turicibacter sp.]|nr:heavy-metal-associated domain-containing protein [Turicibacter sp.]
MRCSKCMSHVQEALEALDHTTNIQVDLGTQSALIDTHANDELIKQAIVEAGYTVLGID